MFIHFQKGQNILLAGLRATNDMQTQDLIEESSKIREATVERENESTVFLFSFKFFFIADVVTIYFSFCSRKWKEAEDIVEREC